MRVLYLFSPSPVRKSGIKYPEIRYLLECFLAAGPSMTYLWLAAVGAIAMLTGPLVGGLINNRTTWRWVFLIRYVRLLPCWTLDSSLIEIALQSLQLL